MDNKQRCWIITTTRMKKMMMMMIIEWWRYFSQRRQCNRNEDKFRIALQSENTFYSSSSCKNFQQPFFIYRTYFLKVLLIYMHLHIRLYLTILSSASSSSLSSSLRLRSSSLFFILHSSSLIFVRFKICVYACVY